MSEPYNAREDKEPDEEKKTTAPHPMSDISKVSKKGSPFAILGWGVLGVIVLLILFSSFLHSGKKEKLNSDLQTNADYKRQLAENMAAIQQAKKADSQTTQAVSNQQTAQPVQPQKPEPTPEQLADFQARLQVAQQRQAQEEADFQARLKAPTSLLINPPSANQASAQGAATGQGTAQAVFAGSGANSSFGNQRTDVVTVSAMQIAHPDSTVASGELVQAILETPINSDLPGMVRAVTSQPVYAYTGNTPLIPAGSRLIGQYSAGIVQGQSRVMVVWNRVICNRSINRPYRNVMNSDRLFFI
ncbi:MAG: TrbI/VirB10 family protein [Legionellales bacterium]|nr:TrbI/VirB10 family protein [Legionellales bacterium]